MSTLRTAPLLILSVPTASSPRSPFRTWPSMMSPELIVFAPPGWVAHATPPLRAKNSATQPIALLRM
jgi:hypothetical protein